MKTGFMGDYQVNTCFTGAWHKMWLQTELRGSGLQRELAWVADLSIGGDLDVICMHSLRNTTNRNKQKPSLS